MFINTNDDNGIEKIFGMNIKGLLSLRKKLTIMGIGIEDIIEFIDRDAVQLFAEQQAEIKLLKRKVAYIKEIVKDA